MAIITLTTDFGTTDHRVASIKGSILTQQIGVPIVDITHDIEPYNLLQAGYILKNAYHRFPKGTIHLIAVDSHHHKDKKFLVCKNEDYYFIVPDNGILSLVFQGVKLDKIYEITLNNRFDDIVNFTPIDIFVPVAVHLYKGGVPEIVGREISDYKEITLPNSVFNEDQKILIGEIIYIDHFGNAISNINKEIFEKYCFNSEEFKIKIRGYNLNKISDKITDVVLNWKEESFYEGRAAAFFNECSLLEIGIYKSNKYRGASTLMGLNIGEKIFIEFS